MKNKSEAYFHPYLPDILINSISDRQKQPEKVIINGSLLFADLSGFTAMSEKLAGLGRLGGEKLAGIMNNCFNSLLGLVFSENGDIIKFGGDAFLALFTGEDNTKRAYRCASDLISWINQNGKISTPVGDFSLGIHSGISEGEIFNLYIGHKRREHLFCGQTVEDAYAVADVAGLGELALTSDAVEKIGDLDVMKTDDGFFLCGKLAESSTLKPSPRPPAITAIGDLSGFENFIITGLERQLHYNNGIIEGEHRVLTNLFIGVNSLRRNLEADLDKSIVTINEYFTRINDIFEKYGGAFTRLDSSGTSEKMLVFFGAPVSTGRDVHGCLKAVLEIESVMSELNEKFHHPISHRYGINTGLCFVGDVGGESRREYTAMGDAINLAARLMSKAGYGEALVGEVSLKTCGNDFITRDGGLVSVKGKAKPVRLRYLEKEVEDSISSEIMIGREAELEGARIFIEKAKTGKRSHLLISGEPGAGKSLLCSKIKQLAAIEGFNSVEGACFKHAEKTPYGPLKAILLGLMNLDTRSPQKKRRAALNQQMKAIGETEWVPLIAPLLDYFPSVPPHLKNLPEDIKKKKIQDILTRLIYEINTHNPSILVIEDIQWIDDSSYEIAKSLMTTPDAPGLLLISRPGEIFDELKLKPNIESFELGGLSRENSRKLFLTILKDIVPDDNIISQVIDKSGGNPFFLEEMAKAFRELGPDRFTAGENIPSGIESVITARIDNLGEMVKKTVRTASVIGRVFAHNVLQDIFPDRKRAAKLRSYLEELAHLDLTPLERRQPVLEYFFKHILTQEVAYNGLSFSARKARHLKTAEFYAKRKRLTKKEPEVPARHYLLAEEPEKALPFIYLAGKKAAAEFANSEAFGFFEKTIEIADKINSSEYLIKTLQSRGELAKHTGDFKLAESDYLKLKKLVIDDLATKAVALQKLSEIYRLTAEYKKADQVTDELQNLLPDDVCIRVFCLNSKAEIARRGGKLQNCRDLLLEASRLCQNNDVPGQLTAMIYNNLGICHWSLGKLNESADYYKLAQTLYRKLKDLSGQSKVMNNLGIISDELGKLHQAAKSYEKAEKIFKRIGATRMEAFACANLGTNLSVRGYLNQAEEKLNRAKDIFERIGDQHSLGFAIGDLGHLYFRSGNLDDAMRYFKDALKKAINVKDDEFIIESRLRLERLQLIRGKIDSINIDILIREARNVGSAELMIKALLLKAFIQMGGANDDQLKETLASIYKIDELKDYPQQLLELAKIETMFYYFGNDKGKALKTLTQAFKKSAAGDLAMYALELAIVGEACQLMDDIPLRLKSKINEFYNRLQDSMKAGDIENFNVGFKRRIELIGSFIESLNNTQEKPNLLEKSNR
ncbi:MAG: tetratricopeptide repeat protein [candidate division Zixibacteria bacterium]|nr:tetratricopeptide repeat protein [candidate division Zixibacteria bacterium]